MAYQKKAWKNRESEHPNRRRLTPIGGNTYDVEREEGLTMVEGDAFDAATMNDLENRISSAFASDGVATYRAQFSGSTLALSGAGDNIRFVAPGDCKANMTVTVNGASVTARTADGSALWEGYFKSGAVIVCYRNGSTLTFSGGGLSSADKNTVRQNMKKGTSILGGSVAGTLEYKIFGTAYACAMGENYDSSGVSSGSALGMAYTHNPITNKDGKAQTGTFTIDEPGNYELRITGVVERYSNGTPVTGIKITSGGKTTELGRTEHGSIGDSSKFALSYNRTYTRALKKGDKVCAYAHGRNNVYNFGSVNLLLIKK